ncbi:MAG: methyltransferase domain-containing protein [Azospirillum sp.]|nr:methyltransferase domain-containing protein [Azospirillum sp.]
MQPTNRNNDDSAPEDSASLSLKTRLVAWWEGYDLSAIKRRQKPDPHDAGGAAKREGPPEAGSNRHGKPLWTATRIEVAEKIWGEGFVSPGGGEQLVTMVKPLGLNPAMSVLDLGAGLGGATRVMAGNFGAWVTGFEASPLLCEIGMQRSVKAGLAKQAPIDRYDPETFRYPKRVDAIFAKEAFFTIGNKEGLFDSMLAALKPRGQLLYTDYVAEPYVLDEPAMKAWASREPQEPKLWSLQLASEALRQRNLDLRICEDVTDAHRSLILSSVKALTDHLEKHCLDEQTKSHVLDEVELWAARVVALQSGLRCFRFYALKPAD